MSSRKERIKKERAEKRNRRRRDAKKHTRFLISITSYDRPKLALSLLKQISKSKSELKRKKIIIDVCFYNDCSLLDYSEVKSFIFKNNWKYIKNERNFGKFEHWRLYNKILGAFHKDFDGKKRSMDIPSASFYVFLQDDNILTENFFEKIIKLKATVKNPHFIANLFRDETALKGKARWTGRDFIKKEEYDICHFVDGMFVTCSFLLESIKWKIDDIPFSRWLKNPTCSSGVGRQLTHKINEKNMSVYMHNNSFVQQADGYSVMNFGKNIKSINFK
jgi:hypothetical protein